MWYQEGRREERGESDNLGLRELRGISLASADAAVRVKVSEQHSRVESHPHASCSFLLTHARGFGLLSNRYLRLVKTSNQFNRT